MPKLPPHKRKLLLMTIGMAVFGLLKSTTLNAVESRVAEADNTIDVITVTATRTKRQSRFVAEAISVVDAKRIENSKMFNVTDALSGIPGVLINTKSGAYDARLMIRGGGL